MNADVANRFPLHCRRCGQEHSGAVIGHGRVRRDVCADCLRVSRGALRTAGYGWVPRANPLALVAAIFIGRRGRHGLR